MSLFLLMSAFAAPKGPKISTYPLENPPSLGKTEAQQEIFLGGFSGLQFLKKENSELFFVTHTDRGPNPENLGEKRPFALLKYTPEIIFFSIKEGHWHISKRVPLRFSKDQNISGLPNKKKDEQPIDLKGSALKYDENGLDLEGIVIDSKNGYWLGDEYGPSLVHFDSNGLFVKRLQPGHGLPAIYASRKLNRGFEGISIEGEKLYGFLQSPLPEDKERGRILELNLKDNSTTEYFYPFEKDTGKIGDSISIGKKQFLVLEQNSEVGKKAQKKIFKIKLAEANKSVQKDLFLDLSDTRVADFEKVEGLAKIDEKTLALITDNDFGISGKPEIKTGKIFFKNEKSHLIVVEIP